MKDIDKEQIAVLVMGFIFCAIFGLTFLLVRQVGNEWKKTSCDSFKELPTMLVPAKCLTKN